MSRDVRGANHGLRLHHVKRAAGAGGQTARGDGFGEVATQVVGVTVNAAHLTGGEEAGNGVALNVENLAANAATRATLS